jgi:subtilisin family serine protease
MERSSASRRARSFLAARAFDEDHDSTAKSSAIYKSLQWAADNGARVVNMSFAGPADPTLHRLLAAAAEKGLVLIAAAGNAGPASPPLYPGADSNVIAVTATDSGDAIFAMANRGNYIAVAAPGVDILALAPGDRCSSRPARQSLPPMSAGSRRSCSNASPRSSRPTFAPCSQARPSRSAPAPSW